jgi:hypothetical protein
MADSESTPPLAPLLNADSKTAIPGEYVVILKKGSDCKYYSNYCYLDAHLKAVEEVSSTVGEEAKILNTFTTVMIGYGIKCGERVLNGIRAMKDVDYVEANQVRHL